MFRGGVVSYWTEIKAADWAFPRKILDQYGAVSEQTARAMAQGPGGLPGGSGLLRHRSGSPDPDERAPPWASSISFWTPPTAPSAGRWTPDGAAGTDPGLAANHAFDVLRRYLTGLPVEALL